MEWVETTGKSVEDAVASALDLLGVDGSEAEYEVLDEGKAGMFGRTKREARVRARVIPSIPRSKDLNRRTRRRRDDRSESKKFEDDNKPPVGKRERESRPVANDSEKHTRRMPTKMNDEAAREEVEEDPVPMVEQAGAAQAFLAGLMREFQMAGQVEVQAIESDSVSIAITGDSNYGLLIGPKGYVMNSVQELARASVQNRFRRANGRIFLDIGGFKEKRRASLEAFAQRVASDVIATGKQRALEPMSSADRKIVHDAMSEIEGVETISEGREPRRYVVVAPRSEVDAYN